MSVTSQSSDFRETLMIGVQKLYRRKVVDGICLTLAAGLILLIAAFSILKPAYNWDMIAYVAAALEPEYPNPTDLHQQTWAVIEAGASEGDMRRLTDANPYNKANYESPEALQSQLVMFAVKPLYVWSIRALEPIIGIAKAAMAMSWAPGIFVGFFTLFWLWRADALHAAPLVLPMFIIGDYFHMARNVVPDMMHAAIALPALYALARGKSWIAAVFLIVAVGIRPDSIILTFALLLVAPFFGLRIIPILAAFIGGLIAAKIIANYYDHIGWWSHFVFSTVELQANVDKFDPAFSLNTMITGYVRGVSVALQHSEWPWLFAILIFTRLFALAKGIVGEAKIEAVFAGCALGLLGKFASFPLPDDRFYFIFIAGMTIALAAIIKPSLEPQSLRSSAAA